MAAILTPRSDIAFLDAALSLDAHRALLTSSPHVVLPLCRGGLDQVIGFVRSTDILAALLRGDAVDLERLAAPPLFVPRTVSLMALLQQFKGTHLPVALVVDEFGSVVGLVSLTDVTAAIVGDLAETTPDDPALVERPDGSLLVDGSVEVDRLARQLGTRLLDESEERQYHGLAMFALGRVPGEGDAFEREGHRLEVVDMDGNRVDKVLVTPARTRRRSARPTP